jgi:FKBP-type peptidyl-prolyl cis-trans isomerase 2
MAAASARDATGETARDGDLVLLEYDLWAEAAGKTELVDTTRAETAQQAGVSIREGQEFGPRPHLVGGDYFPPGIERSLVGLRVGEEVEKEFAPADAFGERDPKLIELFGMHEIQRLPEMRREKAELDVGTVLNIRGRRGRVVSLTAARVRVDFNPAFAGRKIRAKFKVLNPITDSVDRVKAIVDLTYGRGKEFHVQMRDGTVTLRVPDRTKFDLNWLAAKSRVIERLREHVKPKSIHIVEEYVTPAPTPAPGAAAAEAKPAKDVEAAEESAPAEAEVPSDEGS